MKKRLLITSIVMMLVVAVALSTATYAWFSTNKSVTGTGMTVTAQSNAASLQIQNSSGSSSNDAKTSAAAATTAKSIYPVDYKSIATNGTITWGTATSSDPTSVNYTGKNDLASVESANVGSYVWSDTFDLWMADTTSGGTATNLILSAVSVTGTTSSVGAALRVLVVGADGAMLWYNTGASENSTALSGGISVINYKESQTAPTSLVASISNGIANKTTVTVYIYYCGNDDSVKTTTAQSLTALTVTLTFAID